MFRFPGLALCFLLSAGAALGQTDPPSPVRLLLPAYFYPAGEGLKEWDRLIQAHDPNRRIEIVPIININSGVPGDKVDAAYQKVIERAAEKKLHLLAYVASNYANKDGKAPLDKVKQNISNYFKLYPQLGGLFVDEQSSQAKDLTYYREIRAHLLKTLGRADEDEPTGGKPLMVGNPGVPCAEEYLAKDKIRTMDVVVMYENVEAGNASVGVPAFKDYRHPAWAKSYKPERFAALVYGCPELRHLERVREQKFGYIYMTDRKGGNPWARLPSYWATETERLAEINK
jgi:hypothetical protein